MSQDLPLPSKIEIDVTLSQIYDSKEPDAPDVTTYGYLYKTEGDNALWWRTIGGIVNLTSPAVDSFGTSTSLFGGTITVVAPSNTKGGTNALDTMGSGTNGGASTAFGARALMDLPDDADQGIFTVFGYEAGMSLAAGFGSIFIGCQSGANLTGSNNDISIGYQSLGNATGSGNGNIAIGNKTMYSADFDGALNVCVGNEALHDLTTGENNVVMGYESGYSTTTGSYNVLLGHNCGFAITTGTSNIGIGRNALNSVVDSTENIGIGDNVMPLAIGDGTTAVGNQACAALTSGTYNTVIGNYAGFLVSTGSFNTILGQSATADAAHDNCIVVGADAKSSASAQIRIGFDTSFATKQTSCYIDGIRGVTTTENDAVAILVDSKGQLGTISSSIRYKENVATIDDNIIDTVFKMRPTSFNYKNTGAYTYGMIAEEMEEILPQIVVHKDYDGKMLPETIQYHLLIPLLVGAVKKLKLECAELRQMYSNAI